MTHRLWTFREWRSEMQAMRGRPSVLKNVLAVILKERRVRLRNFIGQMNSVACILGEALLQRGVWEITRETLAEDRVETVRRVS